MGSEMGFQTWFEFPIYPFRHALLLWPHCSDCFCLLCCVICCFGNIKTHLEWFYHPKGVGFNEGGGFIPQKEWLYPPKGVVLSSKRGGFITFIIGHKTTLGGFKDGFLPHLAHMARAHRAKTAPVH